METPGRDRYDALLRHLQAGRELPIQPRQRSFRPSVDVHRVGPRILGIAMVALVVWVGAVAVTDRLKSERVDTWSGPDATVHSGLRLEGCDIPGFDEDSVFPGWIRFDGRVYRWADLSAPISDGSIPTSYTPTGYELGALKMFRVNATAAGSDQERILVRNGESNAGAVYLLTPECQ